MFLDSLDSGSKQGTAQNYVRYRHNSSAGRSRRQGRCVQQRLSAVVELVGAVVKLQPASCLAP